MAILCLDNDGKPIKDDKVIPQTIERLNQHGKLVEIAIPVREKDFNDVMDSNFSKFCTSQDEADKTVEAYANGTHPNKNGEKIKCYHVKVGDYWIVKRVEDGKILKSINFKEVDFK